MVIGFAYPYQKAGTEYAQATVFYVPTFSQLFFAFAWRSQSYGSPPCL